MNKSLKLWFATICALVMAQGQASIPTGYYDSCEGKSSQALLKALSEKIWNVVADKKFIAKFRFIPHGFLLNRTQMKISFLQYERKAGQIIGRLFIW